MSVNALSTSKSWGTGSEAQTHMPAMHSRESGKNCDPLEGCRRKGTTWARSGSEKQGIKQGMLVPDPWGSATRLGSEPLLTHKPGWIDFTFKAGWIRQDLGAGNTTRGQRLGKLSGEDQDPQEVIYGMFSAHQALSPWRTQCLLPTPHGESLPSS